jgi:hypothetical protein
MLFREITIVYSEKSYETHKYILWEKCTVTEH